MGDERAEAGTVEVSGSRPGLPPHDPHQQRPGAGRRRLRVALLSLACVVAVGSAGLGGAALAASTRGQVAQGMPVAPGAKKGAVLTKAEIQAELDRHAEALRDEDKGAYLALYDETKKELVKRETQRYENLVKVPFEKVAYELDHRSGEKVDKFDQGIRATIDVAFVHRIKGVDVRPVAQWYRWVVVAEPRSGQLEVTKVKPSPGLDYASRASFYPAHPAPWDIYTHMVVVRRPHVLILASREAAGTARKYADVFEWAAKKNLAAWKKKGPDSGVTLPGFLVTFEDERRSFLGMYGTDHEGDTEHLAGFSRWLPIYDGGGKAANSEGLAYGGARVVVDPTSGFFRQSGVRGVREIARHELAHSLVSPLGTGSESAFAAWVVEGFAEYMGLRGRPVGSGMHFRALRAYVGSGRFDGTLPSEQEIHSTSLTEANASYQLGCLALRFIADKYGEDRMLRLVAGHYEDPHNLERHIRRATGLSMATFEKRWAAYVRRQIS